MTKIDVQSTLATLRREYDETAEIRTKADARLTQLQAAISALTALATDDPLPAFEGSLADACRMVLRRQTTALTPIEVRDAVVASGYPITSKHKNAMAAVHGVLKRLTQFGDVEATTRSNSDGDKDETVYRWTGRATTTRAVATLADPLQGLDMERFRDTYERLAQTFSQVTENMDTSALARFAVDVQATSERLAAVLPKVGKK